jgi:predicted transcriptional regulator YdeE
MILMNYVKYYRKYFKQRRKDSRWSEKNKKLTEKLESQNIMTEYGREKVKYAKEHGFWDSSEKEELTDEHIHQFENMVKPYEPAYTNFIKMAKSARKAYATSYFWGAKTEEGKQKRFNTIIERLDLNLNPKVTEASKLRTHICLTVSKPVEPKGEINVKTIEGGKYAKFLYQGPYSNLSAVYYAIYSRWLPESGCTLKDIPWFEKYINNPNSASPEKLKTEIKTSISKVLDTAFVIVVK